MDISILTLFPEVIQNVLSSSIIGRAQKKGLLTFHIINIRNFATDKHRSVDDKPFGGGVGMIMRVDIVEKALSQAKKIFRQKHRISVSQEKTVLLDPAGTIFSQSTARKYSKLDHLILICGHYEGIDYRIRNFCDETLSIGKYVLTGGEIPAMVVSDTVSRLVPGVLEKKEATLYESYNKKNVAEYPQYTRPQIYKGLTVPNVLISGNHKKIAEWKEKMAGKIRK